MLEYLKLLSSALLGSGAAFAAIKLIFEKRKEERERSEAIKYLALQLAFLFEGFTLTCANGASDHQTAVENNGHAGAFLRAVPMPPAIPTADTYRYMNSALLNRVLAFPQKCQIGQLAADFWANTVGDDECYGAAVEENTILMGQEALSIAKEIRSTYALGERSLTFGNWKIDDFMRSESEKVQKRLLKQDRIEREAIKQQAC